MANAIFGNCNDYEIEAKRQECSPLFSMCRKKARQPEGIEECFVVVVMFWGILFLSGLSAWLARLISTYLTHGRLDEL